VWIFGAGITGLTAAHELIERGFEVYVVEPTDDPWEPDLPAVGGVARTQWAMIPKAADNTAPEALVETVPMLRHPVLEFEDLGDLADAFGEHEQWELDAFAAKLRTVYRARLPAVRMQVSARFSTMAEHDNVVLQRLLTTIQEYAATQHIRLVQDTTLNIDTPESDRVRVTLVLEGRGVVPGEHGFRYFPGFYRHLFDTMRRTAVLSPGEDRYGPVVRSVFDNLVGTEATWLHLPHAPATAKDADPATNAEADAAKATAPATPKPASTSVTPPGSAAGQTEINTPSGRLIRFPRRPPRSPQAVLQALRSFVNDLGYETGDLTHLSLKLFQYMTTCKARRAAEHEDMTWSEFLQIEKFSKRCQAHMERGPEVLGAMTATESDVRTQGNMVTQLLLDQLVGRQVTDATLNGPTSLAWFDQWREYLIYRGVKFFRGTLVDFDLPDPTNPDHLAEVLLPRVSISHRILDTRSFTTAVRPHYFVLATPLTAMLRRDEFVRQNPECTVPLDEFGVPGTNLAQRFLSQHAALRVQVGKDLHATAMRVDDFEALQRWDERIAEESEGEFGRARGAGPLRHLCGVQFFFPANLQFGQEHTLYMESGWRLSSISQVHFWHRRPTGSEGYRGIVSVDLGALFRPLGRALEGRGPADTSTTWAWNLPRAVIAEQVFRDVADSIAVNTLDQRRRGDFRSGGSSARNRENPNTPYQSPVPVWQTGAGSTASQRTKPEPLCYHFDQSVVFKTDGSGIEKNLAPYLINRPGEWVRRPGTLPSGDDAQRGYALQNNRWVLAGTYMKTHTRLTTMEAANESARHAVNAILNDQNALGDRCMISDPEDFEYPELNDLKALDARLFQAGYPHMVEILGLDEVPWALLPNLSNAPAETE